MLYDALNACLERSDFASLSVTEVASRATVSRSTFYRNFDELVDILCWKCDRQFSEVLRGYVKEGCWEKLGMLEYVFKYWQKHSEVLEILLSINRIDIIYDCFARNSTVVMVQLQERMKLPKGQSEYFMAIRIGVFIGVMKTWLRRGKKESAHQLSVTLGEQLQYIANSRLVF
jgi:Transcriptional regulator